MARTRRAFFKLAVAVGGVPAFAALLPPERSAAQDLPRLAEDDPTAVALAYVHDATKSKHPRYQASQTCANCQQVRRLPISPTAPLLSVEGL